MFLTLNVLKIFRFEDIVNFCEDVMGVDGWHVLIAYENAPFSTSGSLAGKPIPPKHLMLTVNSSLICRVTVEILSTWHLTAALMVDPALSYIFSGTSPQHGSVPAPLGRHGAVWRVPSYRVILWSPANWGLFRQSDHTWQRKTCLFIYPDPFISLFAFAAKYHLS